MLELFVGDHSTATAGTDHDLDTAVDRPSSRPPWLREGLSRIRKVVQTHPGKHVLSTSYRLRGFRYIPQHELLL